MNIIIFVIILLVLVLSHEFGHFIVAKLNKIRVDEFAFGFPPRLFFVKKGETKYSFNLLPLGGYVKIFGENPDEDSISGPDKKRSFVNKPKYVQAMVLLAGVTMNFLVAWILISVGFMIGLPSSVTASRNVEFITDKNVTIISVNKNSPAEVAGLKSGDKLISMKTENDFTTIPSTESIQYFIKRNAEKNITLEYIRGQELLQTEITPKIEADGLPKIGISMDLIGKLQLPLFSALWEGMKLSANLFVATAQGFYTLIHDAILGQADLSAITGPVGLVGIVGDAAEFGFVYLLSFVALISMNLVIINLFPFPALDGGRLIFLLIEKIKGSRIKPKVANIINTIGFGLLMILMVVITFNDVVKLF